MTILLYEFTDANGMWDGWSGAERGPHGEEPVFGTVSVEVAKGAYRQCLIVVDNNGIELTHVTASWQTCMRFSRVVNDLPTFKQIVASLPDPLPMDCPIFQELDFTDWDWSPVSAMERD